MYCFKTTPCEGFSPLCTHWSAEVLGNPPPFWGLDQECGAGCFGEAKSGCKRYQLELLPLLLQGVWHQLMSLGHRLNCCTVPYWEWTPIQKEGCRKDPPPQQHPTSWDAFRTLRGWDFPSGPVMKNPPADAGDTVLIPGPGRFYLLPSN